MIPDLNKILDDLRAEISSDLRKISSNRPVDPRAKFVEFSATEDNQDIKSYSASARQFQIGIPVDTGDDQIGSTTSHPTFEISIVIAYPDTEKWNAAAIDDLGQIQWYFRTHPSAVSGIALRFVMPTASIVSEKSTDDSRRYWTLTVSVQAEVTY